MNLDSNEPLVHEDDRPRFSGYLVNLGPKPRDTAHEKWVKAAKKADREPPQRQYCDPKYYWQEDRDLAVSRYEPRNDPEPLQRDLFK